MSSAPAPSGQEVSGNRLRRRVLDQGRRGPSFGRSIACRARHDDAGSPRQPVPLGSRVSPCCYLEQHDFLALNETCIAESTQGMVGTVLALSGMFLCPGWRLRPKQGHLPPRAGRAVSLATTEQGFRSPVECGDSTSCLNAGVSDLRRADFTMSKVEVPHRAGGAVLSWQKVRSIWMIEFSVPLIFDLPQGGIRHEQGGLAHRAGGTIRHGPAQAAQQPQPHGRDSHPGAWVRPQSEEVHLCGNTFVKTIENL